MNKQEIIGNRFKRHHCNAKHNTCKNKEGNICNLINPFGVNCNSWNKFKVEENNVITSKENLEAINKVNKELIEKQLKSQSHQCIGVKREIVHTKKIFNVGESPTSGTNNKIKEENNMINPNDMKLNNLCPICKKEIFLMQDYAGKDKVLYHTDCLISQEKQQATKELLEEVNKIIDSLEEGRNKDNSLSYITIGKNFTTNSIKMLKEELKQQLSKLGEEGK